MIVETFMLFLTYFIQLFAIMNPFSVVPFFISVTEGLRGSEVNAIVRKATAAGLTIVIAFTLLGKYILEVFNISIAGLRVGGGILLLVLALDMLGGEPRTKRMDPGDVAVVPIATPLIIGPGTITTLLLLVASKPGDYFNLLIVLVAGVFACILSFTVLRASNILVKILRVSTVRALGRFMSIIIAGMAIEMIARGVVMYYYSLLSS